MLKSFFVAVLLWLSWGFPLCMLGIEQYVSIQVSLVILMPFVAAGVLKFLVYDRKDAYKIIALVFIVYCIAVSAVASTFLLPQSPSGWLPGLVYLMPIGFTFVASMLGIQAKDVFNGFIIACTVGALLVIVDQAVHLPGFDIYVHISSDEAHARRVVFMHNETAFALALCVAKVLAQRRPRSGRIWAGLAALPMAYSLLVISESRLATAAALIGAALYVGAINYATIRPLIIAAAVSLALGVAPFALETYTTRYGSNSLSSDASVETRNNEIDYFSTAFRKTNGIGFGLMSQSRNKPNVLSNGQYVASFKYGYDHAFFGLVDVRILGALYQFGYLGLAFIIALTIISILPMWTFARSRVELYSDEMGAMAAVAFGFCLSPLPANLFTADNTLMIGGMLLFLANYSFNRMRGFNLARTRVGQGRFDNTFPNTTREGMRNSGRLRDGMQVSKSSKTRSDGQ